MSHLRRLVLPLAAASLLVAAPAPASAAGKVVDFGGGALLPGAVDDDVPVVPGDVNISLRLRPGGRIGLDGVVVHDCGAGLTMSAYVGGRARLERDGVFRLTQRRRSDASTSSMVTVTGRVEGDDRVTGIVRSTGRHEGRDCAGTARFVALDTATLSTATDAAVPRAREMLGMVEQEPVPGDLLLRTSESGRELERVSLTLDWRCGGKADTQTLYAFDGTIDARGRLALDHRYERRMLDGTQEGTIALRGQFVAGGVVGTLRATGVTRDASGAELHRCRSIEVPFSAASAVLGPPTPAALAPGPGAPGDPGSPGATIERP